MAAPTDSIPISGLADGVAAQATDIVPAARGAGNVFLTLTYIKTFVLNALTLAWGSITGTPTTIAGYGITDAAPKAATYITTAAEAGLSAESVFGTAVVMSGLAGARPAAATAGRLYYATDTGDFSRDNGATWDLISTAIGTLAAAASVTGTDEYAVNQGGTTRKGTITQLLTYIQSLATFVSATATQAANTMFLGPASGSAAAPAFRAMQNADRALVARYVYLYDDFLSVSLGSFINGSSGTAATVAFTVADSGGHPGIAQCQTGTDTSGFGCIGIQGSPGVSQIQLGNGAWVHESVIRIPVASDGTDTFSTHIGFNDVRGADATDGIYFRYKHSVNSGKFECVTRSNSVETAADSGITMNASQWYKLRIEVNAAATSVLFYIDGVLKVTQTTNIPTGAGRETGVYAGIRKNLGTTSRNLDVDYLLYSCDLTTSR
jgi:hypothetical protein